jgi:hypothetical protein
VDLDTDSDVTTTATTTTAIPNPVSESISSPIIGMFYAYKNLILHSLMPLAGLYFCVGICILLHPCCNLFKVNIIIIDLSHNCLGNGKDAMEIIITAEATSNSEEDKVRVMIMHNISKSFISFSHAIYK